VSNELQNVMLQHANINTFVRHYSVGIHVDAQAIVRGLPPQIQLMRFASSMSRSIDPRRPYKSVDSSIVNEIPRVRALQKAVEQRKQIRQNSPHAERRYQRALRELRNEKQQQRNWLLRQNLERYKDEQPVMDSERQLAGKMVDGEVIGVLERAGYMTPQHMMLIDTILTMPGDTVEKEHQRRIAAIKAVIAFCDVEEGVPSRRPTQKRPAADAPP
jgi:hypothetical protein